MAGLAARLLRCLAPAKQQPNTNQQTQRPSPWLSSIRPAVQPFHPNDRRPNASRFAFLAVGSVAGRLEAEGELPRSILTQPLRSRITGHIRQSDRLPGIVPVHIRLDDDRQSLSSVDRRPNGLKNQFKSRSIAAFARQKRSQGSGYKSRPPPGGTPF